MTILSVIVVVLLIPTTFPLRGETNAIQSLRSSVMFTRDVTLAIAAASSAPEGPARMKSTVCDSGSEIKPYAVAISALLTV